MLLHRKIHIAFVLAVASLLPVAGHAQAVFPPRQEIAVTIQPDYKATGVWALPLFSKDGVNSLYVPEFRHYGSTMSTQYVLTGIDNDKNESLPFSRENDDVFSFNPLAGSKQISRFFLHYNIMPAFKYPVAIYEFWVADGGYRLNPTVAISYPPGWKVLTMWPPEAEINANTISIKDLSKYEELRPIIVVFDTQGPGVVETVGKYTISGTSENVEKLKKALAKIDFVDDFMNEEVGIKPPEKVVIISDNLTQAGEVGYDTEAIAAAPNVIIFNNQFVKKKSTEEVAVILSHELMHLAIGSQSLFRGFSYFAPWFDEGMAVFFETQVHNKIYTDADKKILVEELNRVHAVSPAEAAVLYEQNFDFLFDGNRMLGTSASYMHAGLVFDRFYDRAGNAGFKKLFSNLKGYNPGGVRGLILSSLGGISGLKEAELLYPGKSEQEISSVLSRISHQDNNEEESVRVVTNYIEHNVKHYFVAGSNPSEPVLEQVAVKKNAPSTEGKKKEETKKPDVLQASVVAVPSPVVKKIAALVVATTVSPIHPHISSSSQVNKPKPSIGSKFRSFWKKLFKR